MEQTKQDALFSVQPEAKEAQSTGLKTEEKGSDTTPTPQVEIPIKFNHVRRRLSVAEAAVLAQKGLQAEAFLPKLQFLAAVEQKSVSQMVDRLYTEEQDKTRADFLSRVQDPQLAEQLLESRNQQVGKAYESLQKAQAAEAQQKAEKERSAQWQKLQAEVPELTEVPTAVQQIADNAGVSLFDAYLRFCWQESKRIAAAEAQQALASARSAGSQKSVAGQGSEYSAMLRGVWSR